MRAKAKSKDRKSRPKPKAKRGSKSKASLFESTSCVPPVESKGHIYYAHSKWQTSPDPSTLPMPRFDCLDEDTKPFLLTPNMILSSMPNPPSVAFSNPPSSIQEFKSIQVDKVMSEKESKHDEKSEETDRPSLTPPLSKEDPRSRIPDRPD